MARNEPRVSQHHALVSSAQVVPFHPRCRARNGEGLGISPSFGKTVWLCAFCRFRLFFPCCSFVSNIFVLFQHSTRDPQIRRLQTVFRKISGENPWQTIVCWYFRRIIIPRFLGCKMDFVRTVWLARIRESPPHFLGRTLPSHNQHPGR